MKKLLINSITVLLVFGGVALATNAFFSDEEKSTGNTFTAGAIDLKVDNTSYYNGVFNPATSWTISDLTVEKFFNFNDIKPGDTGEDTISLHVDSNPAYACLRFTQTENSDNGFSEPEDMVNGTVNNSDGTALGDLGNRIFFKFWLDDGDNVLEQGETSINSLSGRLDQLFAQTYTLADATTTPLDPQQTYYIGKAWCYGQFGNPNIFPQDGLGFTQAVGGNGPDVRQNFTCDGSIAGNIGQTDIFTGDIQFYAIQARNNPNFSCNSVTWENETKNIDS